MKFSKTFEKVQNTTFSTPKMAKIRNANYAKSVDFRVYFRSTSSIYGSFVLKKKINHSPW